MPNNVVGEANDLVTCTLSHLGETFRLSLVFESVRWEVNACSCALVNLLVICFRVKLTSSVNVGLDKNAHTTDTVKVHFLVLVLAPISLEAHVISTSLELLVAYAN